MRYHEGSVPFYTFDSLDAFSELVHAVFTRHGGVSEGHLSSLNLGHTVGDDADRVEENHRRVAAVLGVRAGDFVSPHQVHGRRVVRVGSEHRGTVIPEADGLITDEPGVPLLLRFADCTPLLVYDPTHRAIGLGHAGWRGTVLRMAEGLVEAMVQEFGGVPAEMVGAVGPAIGPCCYQVGPDVVASVEESLGPGFLSRREPDGHAHFDLWEANRSQLLDAGVGSVEVAGVCTSCHRDEFFSHRGDGGRTGRFGVAMMLKAPLDAAEGRLAKSVGQEER